MTDDTRDPAATEPSHLVPSAVAPFGTDTPGPEATPEQDEAVTSLLGMLRGDDIAMPDDVVRRLDGVLAEERRRAAARAASGLTAVAALGDVDASGDSDSEGARPGGTGSAAHGLATVLPIGAAPSRRPRDLGWLTWLGGAAAAVIVVGGGFAVLGHGGSSSVSTATSNLAPETTSGSAAAVGAATALRTTNTNYSATTLTTQVGALLSSVKDSAALAAGSPDNATDAAAATSSPASGEVPSALPTAATQSGEATRSSGFSAEDRQALTIDTVAACMVHLEIPGVIPLVVDHGTFDGKPADVVVVPTEGDPATVDVYVLHPGCATAVPLVFEFSTVRRP